jgi:hypothetical protein
MSGSETALRCPHCSHGFDNPAEYRLAGMVVLACPSCHGGLAVLSKRRLAELDADAELNEAA